MANREGIVLRSELSLAANGRAIRLAIYDVGIVLGGILLIDNVPDFLVRAWNSPWEWHSIKDFAVFLALVMWLGLIGSRWTDWRSLSYLEKRLEKLDDE